MEYTKQGNLIERSWLNSPQRLFEIFLGNWKALYINEDYDRVYVDYAAMQTLSYTEGDVTLVTCNNHGDFHEFQKTG